MTAASSASTLYRAATGTEPSASTMVFFITSWRGCARWMRPSRSAKTSIPASYAGRPGWRTWRVTTRRTSDASFLVVGSTIPDLADHYHDHDGPNSGQRGEHGRLG